MSPFTIAACPTCGATGGFDHEQHGETIEFTCRDCGAVWTVRAKDVPAAPEGGN